MPDATQIAASQSLSQYLFYFICVMGLAMGGSAAWFAKYILLPVRDRHFGFLDAQVAFMRAMETMLGDMASDDQTRKKMHEENLKKLSEIHHVMIAIHRKVGNGPFPPRHPEPSAG